MHQDRYRQVIEISSGDSSKAIALGRKGTLEQHRYCDIQNSSILTVSNSNLWERDCLSLIFVLPSLTVICSPFPINMIFPFALLLPLLSILEYHPQWSTWIGSFLKLSRLAGLADGISDCLHTRRLISTSEGRLLYLHHDCYHQHWNHHQVCDASFWY